MKRNAKINSRKLSLICLVLTLVIAMTAIFVVTASAAEETETITFDANHTQRVSQDSDSQVWKSDNVTFINNKANSSTAVGDYSNPVRIYAGSTLTIECTGTMTQIVIVSDGTAKYKTALQNAITQAGYTYTASSNNYTITLNSVTKIDLSFSAQARFKSITVTFEPTSTSDPDTPACEHTNTTTTTTPADCTTPGSIVTICDDCGEETGREVIPETGHEKTTTTTVDSTCKTNGSVTVTCDKCSAIVSSEIIDKKEHSLGADNKCTVCGYNPDNGLSGRYVIMAKRASETTYRYIKGEANGSRYALADSGLTVLPTSNDGSDSSLIFVLTKNADGTYKIYAEGSEKYLGWSSGNTGDFVTEDNAKNVTIDELESGLFNIHFTGDAERYLSLNATASNNYAAWYKTGQTKDLALIPVVEPEPECDHAPKLDYANVNLGQSLALKYYVELCEHANVADYTMKFTMNGVETTVSAEAEKYNGLYVFTLGGIAPQCMGDEIVAELIYEGTAALTKTYSVKQNLIDLLADPANADDNELKTLIYNTLAYGAEAQKYTGYKTDALVNAGYEALATQNAQPTDAHVLSALKDGATASFKSAAVEFGDVNKIIVKINAADVANVTLKVGETALTLTKVSDGVYSATTDGISALGLGAKVDFNLYVGEDLVQTLTYSVNDYASRKWDDAEMGALVKALYNYGVAAAAFAN